MNRLIEGYRRFRSDIWPAERKRYEALAKRGQHPDTLVVACSDSRVDPQTVFGAVPGELFVVRNIAGLVPPYQPDAHAHGSSAALEYGVRVLKVKHIVVLGHAQCGGVRALVEGAPAEARDFVEPWMALAKSVLPPVSHHLPTETVLASCEMEVVRLSLLNLRTFPWVAEAVEAGRLDLHGFSFDVHTGVLSQLTDEGYVPVL
jgi:carbonic anhydrase